MRSPLVLDDTLRRILGPMSCELLQVKCPDCHALCTWARSDANIAPLGGCVCNYFRMKGMVESTVEGWEPYPPSRVV